jgi:hypothetical protein
VNFRGAAQLQTLLRGQQWWVDFREVCKEGWFNAYQRNRLQGAILKTPPVITDKEGDIEVRALTWRRDWKNLIWALKSFYYFSERTYPLFIHDGGLTLEGKLALRKHFPHAILVDRSSANQTVQRELSARNLRRCLAYREKNPSTLKLFDFFALSRARSILTIDSDIVFFAPAIDLLDGHPGKNLYNRDSAYWYSMSLDELELCFNLRPVSHINSGLARVDRCSIDFEAIEEWLEEPRLFADKWVTEQTLHALCSTRYGMELLPPVYSVGTEAGIIEGAICKHYPGYFRPLLYQEGMQLLQKQGFLRALGENHG